MTARVAPWRGPPLSRASVMDTYPTATRVACDASYREGRAGLGVAAPFILHAKVVPAVSNMHGEMLALAWAMELVGERQGQVVFMLDCRGVVDWARGVERLPPGVRTENVEERLLRLRLADEMRQHPAWLVLPVHRSAVERAHRLAGQARRGTLRH